MKGSEWMLKGLGCFLKWPMHDTRDESHAAVTASFNANWATTCIPRQPQELPGATSCQALLAVALSQRYELLFARNLHGTSFGVAATPAPYQPPKRLGHPRMGVFGHADFNTGGVRWKRHAFCLTTRDVFHDKFSAPLAAIFAIECDRRGGQWDSKWPKHAIDYRKTDAGCTQNGLVPLICIVLPGTTEYTSMSMQLDPVGHLGSAPLAALTAAHRIKLPRGMPGCSRRASWTKSWNLL